MYDKIKRWYQQGLWTERMVKNAQVKGVLTEEQVKGILNPEEGEGKTDETQ